MKCHAECGLWGYLLFHHIHGCRCMLIWQPGKHIAHKGGATAPTCKSVGNGMVFLIRVRAQRLLEG